LSLVTLHVGDEGRAVENAYKPCMHIQDPLLPEIMYTAIRSTPGAPLHHGLNTTWKGNCGKSSLGNMGMRRMLADSLCLQGTARHNLKLRWKLMVLDEQEGQYGRLPAHFCDTPLFYSHPGLAAINKWASMYHGSKHCHPEAIELQPDNGERLFSWNLLEQRERNKEFGNHDLNNRYQCPKCTVNPIPLPHLQEAINSNANDPSNDLEMPMDDEAEDGFAKMVMKKTRQSMMMNSTMESG
jgi:hypothetical protein